MSIWGGNPNWLREDVKNLFNEAKQWDQIWKKKKEGTREGGEGEKIIILPEVPWLASGLLYSSNGISSQLKIRKIRKEENKMWFSLGWCNFSVWPLAAKNVIIYPMMGNSKYKHLIEIGWRFLRVLILGLGRRDRRKDGEWKRRELIAHWSISNQK